MSTVRNQLDGRVPIKFFPNRNVSGVLTNGCDGRWHWCTTWCSEKLCIDFNWTISERNDGLVPSSGNCLRLLKRFWGHNAKLFSGHERVKNWTDWSGGSQARVWTQISPSLGHQSKWHWMSSWMISLRFQLLSLALPLPQPWQRLSWDCRLRRSLGESCCDVWRSGPGWMNGEGWCSIRLGLWLTVRPSLGGYVG